MLKQFFIRADGNGEIGMGHVMRSMTISEAFKNNRYECTFICSEPFDKSFFESKGYSVIGVPFVYDEKNMEEARYIKDILLGKKADYLLVDSYYANDEYLNELRNATKVICINGSVKKISADYIINDNIATDIEGLKDLYKDTRTGLLIGCKYAPIRKEFANREYIVNTNVKQILITTGGGDKHNFMTQFFEKVWEPGKYDNIKFVVISGPCNDYVDDLRLKTKDLPNVVVLENVNNIADYMVESDIAISAGGNTVAELATVGVPTIGISIADDQVVGLAHMNNIGMLLDAGSIKDNDFWKKVRDDLDSLVNSCELRAKLSLAAKNIYDGKGAERIFREVTSFEEVL